MTQVISNTLNNVSEMLTNANQSVNKISAIDEIKSVDKTDLNQTDFSKVFDKQIAKENKPTMTLADVKAKKIDCKASENWSDFTKILQKATGEANIETSLDLTLARDINEIISQLKEAIDETTDETEDLVEKTDVVEELTTDTLSDDEIIAEEVVTEELVNNETANKDNETQNKVALYEQILSFVSNADNNQVIKTMQNVAEKIEENVSNELNNYSTDSETMEMFNNLSADDVSSSEDTDTSLDIESLLDEEQLKDLNIETISADTDASNESFLMDSQTPEEQGVKAMLNQEFEAFDLKIDKAVSTQNIQQTQPKAVEVNPSKILDQITKQMETLQNNSKVNVVLNPESLGKVTIQLIRTGEGLSAQFTVANQEVRDMLMKGLDGLKDSLLSHGVGVDNVSVKVSDLLKSEYEADWTEQDGSESGRREQGRSNKEEKEKGLFEQMMAQTLEEENGNV